MAVSTFDAGRGEVTVKDLIARAAFVVIHSAYQVVDALARATRRRATARRLSDLSDVALADIGVTRADIDRISKSF